MVPLFVVAVIAFIFGAIAGVPGSPERDSAARFVEAWSRKDFGAMYRELNTGSRRKVPEAEFVKAYRDGAETATLRSIVRPGPGRRRRAGLLDRRPGPGHRPHRRLRHGRRRPCPALRRRRHRLEPEPGLPRAEHGRTPREQGRTGAPGADPRRQRGIAGRRLGRSPRTPAGQRDDRRHRRNRDGRRRRNPGARPPRLPAGDPGRDQRRRAGFQRQARRTAGRHPAGGRGFRRLGPRSSPGPPRRRAPR